MRAIPIGLYAAWRVHMGTAHTLAERSAHLPLQEPLLRLIWQFQRLRRDQLQTTDGQPLKVLHPGFWNREAGPDFKGAAIQFGDEPVAYGDVEVDLLPQGWQVHRHDENPGYRGVILHVVWEAGASAASSLPTLALKARLDSPLDELELWLRQEPGQELACVLGRCAASLRDLPEDALIVLLEQAALIRLQTKAGHLQARARQAGWDQALWEGLFSALGYKNNVWPMQRLSELLPSIAPDGPARPSCFALQARLLGISGLLPSGPGGGSDAAAYLRKLWDLWWREREEFADFCFPCSLWKLNNLRPANSPYRRLALAAHWLVDTPLTTKLEAWFDAARPDGPLRGSLLQALQADDDPFWSRHWTLQSRPMDLPQPLLGPDRVTDLAMNVILPWFWVRATLGRNELFRTRAEQCYFAWPKAQDNAVLRLARRRLFGAERVGFVRTAARQQGVFQIVRDFCDYSNALCEHCPFPQFVSSSDVGVRNQT